MVNHWFILVLKGQSKKKEERKAIGKVSRKKRQKKQGDKSENM